MSASNRVLAIGVCLTDHPNMAPGISAALAESREWEVDQRWVALGEQPLPATMVHLGVLHASPPAGKFALLNRVLASVPLPSYDFTVVIDDDIQLPSAFLDRYLGWVRRCDLALAQPARTHDSSIDHMIVEQLDGVDCRQTRFVEIGPCFSLRSDASAVLLPFDEAAPMGWGLDFVWPVLIEEAGLKLGIVDATPVRHATRRTVSLYDHAPTERAMHDYLSRRRHLTKSDAFVVLGSQFEVADERGE